MNYPSALRAYYDDEEEEVANVLLYIDDSNMYEMAKRVSASKKKYRPGVQDYACRIDIGALKRKALAGRRLLIARLFGSGPPPEDSVWESIRKKEIDVQTFKRSKVTGKEKQVDQSLVASAVRDIIKMKEEAGNDATLILCSGDRDFLPVVEMAIEEGYRVEIWSFEISISKTFKKFAKKQKGKVGINYIDKVFHELTFTNFLWDPNQPIPRERSVVAFVNLPELYKERQEIFNWIVEKAGEIFRLPMGGLYRDNYRRIVLVSHIEANYSPRRIICSSCGTKKELVRNYDFDRDIMKMVHVLKDSLNHRFNDICSDIKTWHQILSTGEIQEVPDFATVNPFKPLESSDSSDVDDDDEDEEDTEELVDLSNLDPSDGEDSVVSDLSDFFNMPEPTTNYFNPTPIIHHNNGNNDFVQIVHKVGKGKPKKSSKPCEHKYWCAYGSKCIYEHSEKEEKFFELHSDYESRKYYKTRECTRHQTSSCMYSDRPYLCRFAHDMKESRCFCGADGTHWALDCPNRKKL